MSFVVKLISKTYLLIAILIVATIVNLFLFYQDTNSQTTQSYSIIRVGDVKVSAESISALATSVASGNKQDKDQLDKQIQEVEHIVDIIKNGGTIKGQSLDKIPSSLMPDYIKLATSWESYKLKAQHAENTSVFDPEATKALSYILQKNNELVLLADDMVNEFDDLGRDYNKHKEIAKDLAECVNIIGQQTLLISIGEEGDTQKKLKEKKLQVEIGIRKLQQISTVGLDVESVGKEHEELIPIPRENSNALRQLEPLWESMQVRISILEERALLSPEFNVAKNEMNTQKEILYNDIDILLQNRN